MNKGLKKFCKYITQEIGNAANVHVNINKNAANMYMIIPIYSSGGKAPINLYLTFTLSEQNNLYGYGKGIKLNYSKIISGPPLASNNYTIEVTNEDGSVDTYHRVLDSNKYECDGVDTYLIDKQDEIYDERETATIHLIEKDGTKYIYDYHNLQHPYKVEFLNKNYLYIDYTTINGKSLIYSISNNKGENVSFNYQNPHSILITVKRHDVVINTIQIKANINTNNLEQITYKNNHGQEIINYFNFDFINKRVEVLDSIQNYRLRYTYEGNCKVTSFQDGYDSNYNGGTTTSINYLNNVTTINYYKNKFLKVFFDKNDIPLYEMDYKGRVVKYEFDDKKRLITKSDVQLCNPNYAIKYSEINNGFFNNNLNNWQQSGNVSIFFDNDQLDILGKNVVKIQGISSIKQTNSIVGYANDILTFMLLGKGNLNGVFASATIILKKDLEEINKHVIEFSENENIWQFKSIQMEAKENYNKIEVEIKGLNSSTICYFDAIQLYIKPLGSFYKYGKSNNFRYNIFGKRRSILDYNDNNLLKKVFNESSYYNYAYDEKGNIRASQDMYDLVTRYEYDDNNNLINKKIINNDIYIETNEVHEQITDDPNILKDVYYDENRNISEYKYDKILLQIKEFKDKVSTSTEYNYNDWNQIQSYILRKSSYSNQVSFTYNNGYDVETVQLNNGMKYEYHYDSANRLRYVNIINASNATKLIEYSYDDKVDGDEQVYSNNISSKMIGDLGDKYIFIYDEEDKISEVRLQKRNSTTEETLYKYYYEFDNLIKYEELRSNESISYTYDKYNQIIKVTDNYNNYIEYYYDDLGYVISKKIYTNDKKLYETLEPLTISRKVTSQIFFEEYKHNNKIPSLHYSCFFNDLIYDYSDMSVKINKNASAIYYDSEENINEKVIAPSFGNNIATLKDGFVPCIKCDSSNPGITYITNTIEVTPQSCLTVMFWFKPTNDNSNKYIFTCGDKILPLGIFIRETGQLDVIGLGGLLVTTNSIKYNDWNFVALTVYNRYDEIGYPEISNYMINLNGTVKALNTQTPNRIYRNLGSNCHLNFGHDFELSSFIGEITGIVFANNVLSNYTINEYYELFKKNVIDYKYIDSISKTVDISSVNSYESVLFNDFDIIPLNNSLESINGVKPIEFVKRANMIKTFDYDSDLKRSVYQAKNNKLLYDFGLGNVGALVAKVKFNSTSSKQYIFQNISINKSLGLYRYQNKLYLDIDGYQMSTGINVDYGTWKLIMFSWMLIYDNDPERGTVYHFTVRCDGNSETFNKELSFKYNKFKTLIGGKLNVNEIIYPLDGQMEMLGYRHSDMGHYYYDQIRGNFKVTTYSKEYDAFRLLKKQTITKDGSRIVGNVYTYKNVDNNPNRISPLIDKQTILTNTKTTTISYEYDNNNNVTAIKYDNSLVRRYTYTYDGKLESEVLYDSEDVLSYEYDCNGNIKSVICSNFAPNTTTRINYIYSSVYPDRLIKYGTEGHEKDILYEDAFAGNPTFYGNGNQGIYFTWEGRKLSRYYDNVKNLTIDYQYNDQGLRIKKEIKNVSTTKYYYEGSNLISEVTGSKKKYFLYDENSMLYGLIYQNKTYYYIRDILGNILGLIETIINNWIFKRFIRKRKSIYL